MSLSRHVCRGSKVIQFRLFNSLTSCFLKALVSNTGLDPQAFPAHKRKGLRTFHASLIIRLTAAISILQSRRCWHELTPISDLDSNQLIFTWKSKISNNELIWPTASHPRLYANEQLYRCARSGSPCRSYETVG